MTSIISWFILKDGMVFSSETFLNLWERAAWPHFDGYFHAVFAVTNAIANLTLLQVSNIYFSGKEGFIVYTVEYSLIITWEDEQT